MSETETRKTAWTVTDDNGDYLTIDGHMYFSQEIAWQLGREHGIMPFKAGNRTSLKTVVVSR